MIAKGKHLHWLAIVVFLIADIKSWWWLLVLVLLNGIGWWLIFAAAILEVVSLWFQYATFTYVFDEHEIIIKRGLFNKKESHLQYAKIQTLQTKQWFFMVPLNLVSLKIESSAHVTDRAEISIPIISMHEVEQLEQLRQTAENKHTEVNPESVVTVADSDQPQQHYRIKSRDLNLYAATSFTVAPILAGLGVIYNWLDEILPKNWLDGVVDIFGNQDGVLLISELIFLLIISVIISYLLIVQRNYHFTMTKKAEQLSIEKGFFQNNKVSVKLNRIQGLVYEQSWLRQLLHLTTVQALVAANASDDEDSGAVVVMPVVQSKDVTSQISKFVNWAPEQTVVSDNWYQTNRRGQWSLIRNMVVATLVVIVPVSVLWWPYGLLTALLLPIAVGLAVYAAKVNGIGVNTNQLLEVQIGHLFTKKRYMLPLKNIQSIKLSQSVFMRHSKLVHVEVRVRSGNTEELMEVRYLPVDKGAKIFDWFKQNSR